MAQRRPSGAATKRIVALRNDFKQAHEDGMAALADGDFDTLGDALKREREIIDEQKKLIDRSPCASGESRLSVAERFKIGHLANGYPRRR